MSSSNGNHGTLDGEVDSPPADAATAEALIGLIINASDTETAADRIDFIVNATFQGANLSQDLLGMNQGSNDDDEDEEEEKKVEPLTIYGRDMLLLDQ